MQHLSRAFYKGVCSCGADYIGETICNVKIRRNEHERIELIRIQNVLNISKNIWVMVFIGQYYLSIAFRNTFKQNILEANFP